MTLYGFKYLLEIGCHRLLVVNNVCKVVAIFLQELMELTSISNNEDIDFESNLQDDSDPENILQDSSNLIYDSIAVHFNIDVFFIQLFIHIFWPFGMLLSPNMRAQTFFNTVPITVLFNHIAPMLVIITILSYFMMSQSVESSEYQHFQRSLWYPLLFYVLHRATVAIKYASLSRSEYNRYMSENDQAKIAIYSDQMQLTQWLTKLSQRLVEFMLVASAYRVGAHIDQLSIIIANPSSSESAFVQYSTWKAFILRYYPKSINENEEEVDKNVDDEGLDDETKVNKYLIQQHDGKYRLSLFNLCKIISQSSHRQSYSYHAIRVSYIVTIIMTSIPFFGFIDLYNCKRWTVVYLVSSAIITFNFFRIVCVFLFVQIVELLKIHKRCVLMHKMIRVSDIEVMTQVSWGVTDDKISTDDDDHTGTTLSTTNPSKRSMSATTNISGGDSSHGNRLKKKDERVQRIEQQNSMVLQALKQVKDGNTIKSTSETKEHVLHRARTSSVVGNSNTSQQYFSVPRISLAMRENINTWCWMNEIMLNMGARYSARLTLFTYLCFVATVVLMVCAIGIIFASGGSEARLTAFASPIFRQAFVAVTIFSSYLIACSYLAANINWERTNMRYGSIYLLNVCYV